MLPLRVRVNLGVMPMKRYAIFLKAQALLEPHHQMQFGHLLVGSYPSTEMQVGEFYISPPLPTGLDIDLVVRLYTY